MSSDDQSTTHGRSHAEPTYDSTLTDIPGARRDHRATVARHQQTGGFPGWQYLAGNHRHRLERWDTMRHTGVHQRAYSHGNGGATCICGLIVSDDPESSGRWLDFFSAPGHLDIHSGETARVFFAQGAPFQTGMWCAMCGNVAALAREVFQLLDDDILADLAEAHTASCKGRAQGAG